MIVNINKIADIRSGYTFRGKAKEKKGSGIYMIQIKDVRDSTVIDNSTLLEIEWQAKSSLPTIKTGEIAIVARGMTNQAALMIDTCSVIPSNQLMIIKVMSNLISPEYLCWWLNRPATQNILSNQHTGTSIPSLTKKELSMLTVPIPERSIQQRIVQLSRLQNQEKTLYQCLIKNREMMLDGMFQQLLTNGKTNER